ncbi:Serine aminopeptidase S33 family [uncultured virus]|nr:Serine aminopeptidase S33 family [uncultured virus]
MQKFIAGFAFVNVPVSYDETLSHLEFVEHTEPQSWTTSISSEETSRRIPVRHYHHNKGPVILMCHGNAEDIGQYDVEHLANMLGFNICVFDYAGYGLHSKRTPSEKDSFIDVETVMHHLMHEKGYQTNQIIVWGRSLGSGLACHLAHTMCKAGTSPLGLILISPLMSCVKVVTNVWTPSDMFMNYRLAPHITCPTLVIHGNDDRVVPYECGESLSQLFTNLSKFETLDGFGHNDVFTSRRCLESIKEFLDQINSA